MKICMGCMGQYKDEYNICPHCGFFEGTRAAEAMHMDPGSILSDRYIIGKVVGFGGFGVTYIGWDAKLERKIAVKEYLPGEFSTRVPGRSQVTVFSDTTKVDQFNTGMKKFIDEARSIVRFQSEDGIVKVYDTFEENNTAYIIMEFLEGETLTEYLKRENTIPTDQAIAMLLPIVRSLQKVHAHGIIHRDIAPDNIHIGTNGKIKLIDFGAARYATTNHSRSLTVIIKPGYSPEEQYRSRGDQGPHTDVYAIGAVLYKMITGVTPPDAMERRAMFEKHGKDMLAPIEKLEKGIPENRAIAITNALNVRIENRTPDMTELENELTTDESVVRREGKIGKIDILKAPLHVKIGIGTAAAAIVTLSVLLATGVINFGPGLTTAMNLPDGMARVPSIVNNEITEAEGRIKEYSLLYAVVGKEYSTLIPADRVLSQDITAGSVVPINSMVSVAISGGVETKAVDEFSGEDVDSVRLALEQQGFSVKIVQEYNREFAPGTVIMQDTEAGTELAVGETVTLVVSMGPDPSETIERVAATVPNLEGMMTDEARKLLVSNGFVFKIMSREYSDDVPESQVISQSVPANANGMTGDVIEIIVSKGPFVAYMPDVQYKHVDDAKYLLQEQQLTYTITYQENETVQADHVISQSIQPKTKLSAGASVSLVVSKGGKAISVPNAAAGNPKLQDARSVLVAAGFSVSVSYEKSETIAEGCVIRQSIAPGASARRGESITLIVSSGKDKQTTLLPSVVGMAQADAKAAIEAASFNASVSEIESATVAQGTVISQNPVGGTEQMNGSTVYITVSKGEPAVIVPDVRGQSQSMAEKVLRDEGLSPSVTTEFSKADDKDKVIAQSPKAGASAKRGDTVTVTISLGAKTDQMPNVIGQAQSTAESAIHALKMNLSISVTQDFSDTVPEGNVVSQTPWAGTSVTDGATVNLVVSKGGTPINIPNIVGASESSARSQLNTAGLRVGSVTQEYSDTIQLGITISQSPTAGTAAKKGDTVNFVVSKGSEQLEVPSLTGYQLTDAQSKNKDFKITESSQMWSDTIPTGFIVSQTPSAGTKAAKGTTINVVVSKGKEPILVPDVVGKTQAQAESDLKNKGFTVAVETGTSMTVVKGSVISQVPAGNISAPKGDTVRIIVCAGKPQVTVPSVVGNTEESARTAIVNAKLEIEVKTANDDNVPQGKVISQSPNANASVDQGSTVSVIVSAGKAEYAVPNVVGKSWSEANTTLTGDPYQFVTRRTDVYHDSVANGNIISTSPATGSKTEKGATVTVEVSMGQKPIPNVIGKSEEAAKSALEAEGFTASVTYDDTKRYDNNTPDGGVLSVGNVANQDKTGTSYSGKKVTITIPRVVSKGRPTVPSVVNMQKNAAATEITKDSEAGFSVAYATEIYSNDVASGYVISQSSVGQQNTGTSVTLTVSKGKPSVPSVVSMQKNAAATEITKDSGAGFSVAYATEVYSNDVASGYVISQSSVGQQNTGTVVTLTVSKGKPSVPNVVNQTKTAAENMIKSDSAANFSVSYATDEYNETVAKDSVIRQSVTGLQNIGTVVQLTISKGKQPMIPNVVNQSQNDAENAIRAAGFIVATTSDYSSTVPSGYVISQSPSAGASNPGITVTLTISKGEEVRITGVSVSASSQSVVAGSSVSFTAMVYGTGSYSRDVTWSVSGQYGNTTIASDGTLYVDQNETANSLTITAKSADSSQTGSTSVTVLPYVDPDMEQ